MKKICMIVQQRDVQGGIASVIEGYYDSILEKSFEINYVESYKDGNKFNKFIKALVGYVHFIKILIMNKPNIIHIHSSFGPSFYRKIPYILFAELSNKVIINHIHGAEFENFYDNASPIKKWLVRKIYNKCDILIALSEEWKVNLGKIVDIKKIKVIENYSIIKSNTIDKRLKKKCKNQVLFLGEIGERKGCYDIPYIVKKVSEVIPDVKFVLAGAGEIEEVNNLLIKLEVSDNVIFPGWLRGEEKDKVLQESDLFLLPSYNEGMPMAILDAMGYGLPVISTNIGGIPKLVISGKNGYVLKAGDIDNISKAIINILTNPDLIKEFGYNSYEVVKSHYSLDIHLNLIGELYAIL